MSEEPETNERPSAAPIGEAIATLFGKGASELLPPNLSPERDVDPAFSRGDAILLRMAAVFNEWARRYAEKPSEFSEILDAEGKPFEDYGESCAAYFRLLAEDLEAEGKMPPPVDALSEKARDYAEFFGDTRTVRRKTEYLYEDGTVGAVRFVLPDGSGVACGDAALIEEVDALVENRKKGGDVDLAEGEEGE